MSQQSQQKLQPPQHQAKQPGMQEPMHPRPQEEDPNYRPAGKLLGKVALITGGDSGIGRSVAILYAKEGADVAIVYLNEHEDAEKTKRRIETIGTRCIALAGDIGEEAFCQEVIQKTVDTFGGLDILVNNAGEQHPAKTLADLTQQQLEKTFKTNLFSMFYLTQAALKYLQPGSAIINTASVTAYRGSAHLLDYASTKGAIVALTRSLSQALVQQGIRVNGVAPGPIWTPLIPASYDENKVAEFGSDTPMQRAGQPCEVAPSYVFLASTADSSYITGQMLHPNGGSMVES